MVKCLWGDLKTSQGRDPGISSPLSLQPIQSLQSLQPMSLAALPHRVRYKTSASSINPPTPGGFSHRICLAAQ